MTSALYSVPKYLQNPSQSPSHLSQSTVRILANKPLPHLIDQKDANTKAHWQEPILDRYRTSLQDTVELWHVQEEYGNDKSKHDGWGKIYIPPWRVLDQRQSSCTGSEKIEPLPKRNISCRHETTKAPVLT